MPRIILVYSFALLGACGGGMGGDDDDVIVNCATETRDDEFGIGLTKPGDNGILQFKLTNATPAPPIRGDNTWVIEVDSIGASSAPVDGATMTVTPFMPDHGHPAGKTVTIEAAPDPGQYEMAPLNFWMPGLWETTLDVTSPGGNDVVVFRICIPS
ncbi:MAG: FixH family protein [Kofleriaceae bacterium]